MKTAISKCTYRCIITSILRILFAEFDLSNTQHYTECNAADTYQDNLSVVLTVEVEVDVWMTADWEVFHLSGTHISPMSPQLDVPDVHKFINSVSIATRISQLVMCYRP